MRAGEKPQFLSLAKTELMPHSRRNDGDTYLAFLGTGGGPTASRDRAGIATALIDQGEIILVDAGCGMIRQFLQAGLTFDRLAAVLITHMHGDHIAELFNLLMFGAKTTAEEIPGLREPIPVIGPGSAKTAPEMDSSGVLPAGTGIRSFFENSQRAFCTTLHNWALFKRSIPDVVTFHEIDPYFEGDDLRALVVYEDNRRRITATTVPHILNSYAYRVDTDHASIVFSGDTGPSKSVISLAQGADALVHEVMDLDALLGMGLPEGLAEPFATVHTEVSTVGTIAREAGVETLILNHFLPSSVQTLSTQQWRERVTGYDGVIVAAEDQQTLSLRRPAHRSSH